ncbi:MAG TPA: hypothetical protein VNW28_10070 [Chthoniobacterales bacterium]|jgi:uncharacterized protein YbbC (DUF1343 family)|nr:hypothetical protein [Chthoniobacterales bacterium]
MHDTRNKKWFVRLAALLSRAASAQGSVELGIDVLASHDYSLLAGKRVGLSTNRTGVNSAGIASWRPNEQEFRTRAQDLLY